MRRGGLRLARESDSERQRREFERLYRESYSFVFNYVYHRLLDYHATEDVTSEAFLRAARFFGRFDPNRARFSTWVISIARNCINDHYAHGQATTPLESVPETHYAQDDALERHACEDDLAERLLGTLDDFERELVFLKYYEGMRNIEIAKELGVNASTVSTKLARALAKMRLLAE